MPVILESPRGRGAGEKGRAKQADEGRRRRGAGGPGRAGRCSEASSSACARGGLVGGGGYRSGIIILDLGVNDEVNKNYTFVLLN